MDTKCSGLQRKSIPIHWCRRQISAFVPISKLNLGPCDEHNQPSATCKLLNTCKLNIALRGRISNLVLSQEMNQLVLLYYRT